MNITIDFPMTEPSIWTAAYCILMYSICLLYSYQISKGWNIYKIQRISVRSICTFTFFIGFYFVTNCMNGDFFHTMQQVHDYYETELYYYNGEPIYRVITSFVDNNYLLFRAIIWGGAFFIFCLTAKRMKIPLFLPVSFICISYSVIFCYARVTAAMAFYFYGLSFFCTPYRYKLLGYFIGLLLIYFSLSFHVSALIMIAMTFMIFLPVKKWSVAIVIIAIPILASFMKEYFFIFALDEDTDEFVANKLLNYSEREVVSGIARQIIDLLTYASYYIPLYFCYKLIIKEKTNREKSEYLLFKVTFGLVYVATSFLFFGETFYTFFYRILNMSMIPITLLVSQLYYEKKMSRKIFLSCILPGVASQIARYSYMIYLNR